MMLSEPQSWNINKPPHEKFTWNKYERREIFLRCRSVFLGRFSLCEMGFLAPCFSLSLSLCSIFFSIAIYDLYVIHISRDLCDIFLFIEFISISWFLVCDFNLGFMPFHAISFNYMFKVFRLDLQNGEKQKLCSSWVYLLVWLNINSCTLLSLEFIVIAWPLSWADDLAIISLAFVHSFVQFHFSRWI